jgi:hypothetical protein
MKPSIFISHSCKDAEKAPPAGLSAEQAQTRAARLRFVRELRDELHRRLARARRFEVFLDVRGGLRPGDIWRDGLHKALRDCAGAVILLSPEALESGWVLKEATILSWRVFMNEALTVIPVRLGVTRQELAAKGFGTINLDAIQWVDVADATSAHRKDAVDKILAVLTAIPVDAPAPTTWRSAAERWIAELAHLLEAAVPEKRKSQYLGEMNRALSITKGPKGRFDPDPFFNIAAQVLTADADQVVKLLNEAGTPSRDQRDEIRNKVEPLWVNPGAANPLPFAARNGRVVAIDAGSVESARDYIRRAYCARIAADRVLVPSDVNEGVSAEIIASIKEYLRRWLPIETPAELTRDIDVNGPAYVLLGPGLARPDVLDELTRTYPQLTLVAVAGAQWRTRLAAWADRVLLLRPLLQPDQERNGVRYRNRLEAFVTQRT